MEPTMMRGMFAAISGLKAHQVMLDVTANDIANVNTVGYKSRAHDVQGLALAAAARRRGAGRTHGGTNAGQVGLGVQLGSIDNLMQPAPSSRPATRSTSRSRATGFFRVAAGDADRLSRRHLQYTRAGNFTLDARRRPRHAGRLLRGRLHDRRRTARPPTTDTLITIPPASTQVVDRPGRHRHLHRPTGAARRDAPPATSRWPSSRTTPASSASPATASSPSANSGAPSRSAPPARAASASITPARSRCRTSTSPRSSRT